MAINFWQDLEGLVYDGQPLQAAAVRRPRPRLKFPKGENHHTLPEWDEYWAKKGMRVATLPELYAEIQAGRAVHNHPGNVITSTMIMPARSWKSFRVVDEYSHDTTRHKIPDAPFLSLDDFLKSHAGTASGLLQTDDGAKTIHDAWIKYFAGHSTIEDKLWIHFRPLNEKTPAGRFATLIFSGRAGISLIYRAEKFAGYTYGVKL